MYIEIKQLHSLFAYLPLALLTVAIVFNAYSWLRKSPFNKTNKLITLLGMVSVHTQFVIGLILYLISPLGLSNFSGNAMKDSQSRLYVLEHPFVMIIALVLITIGYSKAKRQTDDTSKYKKIVIFYSIGLALILTRIPWSSWF
ncbi:MAG TPA: hypothetical protein VFK73_08540 [Paludibacter sp.]|nr:hypothetical protein [Paludibacter sp.]